MLLNWEDEWMNLLIVGLTNNLKKKLNWIIIHDLWKIMIDHNGSIHVLIQFNVCYENWYKWVGVVKASENKTYLPVGGLFV